MDMHNHSSLLVYNGKGDIEDEKTFYFINNTVDLWSY